MSAARDERDRLRSLLSRMAEIEAEIEEEIRRHGDELFEDLADKRESFEREVREAGDRVRENLRSWLRRSEPRNVVSAPFIYAMIVPIVFLDVAFLALPGNLLPPLPHRSRSPCRLDRHRPASASLPERDRES